MRIRTEFLNTLESIELLILSKNTPAHQPPKHILLKDKIETLLTVINKLYHLESQNVNEKFRLLQEFIPKLSKILNLCRSTDACHELNYYNLYTIQLSMIAGLVQLWGTQGRLRAIGSANMLAELLTGINIEPIEKYIPSISHPSFEDTYRLAFNYLNILGGCYYIATTHLYCISYNDFMQWSQFALDTNQRLLQLIKKYWSPAILPKRIQKAKEFNVFPVLQNSFLTNLNAYTQMIRFLLLLDARTQGKWPESFQEIPFLNFESRSAYMQSLWSIHTEITTFRNKFNLLKPLTNHLGTKYHETVEMRIQICFMNQKSISLIEQVLKTNNHTGFKPEINEKLNKQFSSLENEFRNFLLRFATDLEQTQFIESTTAEYWANNFQYIIAAIGIFAQMTHDLRIFNEIEQILYPYFSDTNLGRYPVFTGLYYLISLSLNLIIQESDDWQKYIDKFQIISAHLPYQPRDWFSFNLINENLRVYLNKTTYLEFLRNIELKFNSIKEFLHDSIIKLISDYISMMEKPHQYNKFDRSKIKQHKAITTDPFSFFVPDFQLLQKNNTKRVDIFYKPFNLSKFSIHDNT